MSKVVTGKDGLIKAIRAGRHIMGMDRDTWQRYLKTHVRKAVTQEQADALPDVDIAALGTLQLNRLLDQMRKDGYGRKKGMGDPDPHTVLQRGMIRTLWMAMYRLSIVRSHSQESLDEYCLRQCKRKLESMSVKQCQTLIESLKKWAFREADAKGRDWISDILAGRCVLKEAGGTHGR